MLHSPLHPFGRQPLPDDPGYRRCTDRCCRHNGLPIEIAPLCIRLEPPRDYFRFVGNSSITGLRKSWPSLGRYYKRAQGSPEPLPSC